MEKMRKRKSEIEQLRLEKMALFDENQRLKSQLLHKIREPEKNTSNEHTFSAPLSTNEVGLYEQLCEQKLENERLKNELKALKMKGLNELLLKDYEVQTLKTDKRGLENQLKGLNPRFEIQQSESEASRYHSDDMKFTNEQVLKNVELAAQDENLNRSRGELELKLKQLQTHCNDLHEYLAIKTEQLSGLHSENEEIKTKLERQLSEILDKQSRQQTVTEMEEKKLADNTNETTKTSDQLRRQLHDTKQALLKALKDLEETKSRLSRAYGDRVTDNNPNIADLSNQNRPLKLSERYQELYDNQWTDAFETVNTTFETEEQTICALKDILMKTMVFCQKEAENQMKQITESFTKGKEPPRNILKQLKDLRKATAEMYCRRRFQDCLRYLEQNQVKITTAITGFIQECFEICWLMTVQDPPVVFGPDARLGDMFDRDQYKTYTQDGDKVKLVVWPVMLLHHHGPVLCKGIAQGEASS